MFVSKPNHQLVVCDYGQIEIRVAASVAQDRVLLKAIEDGLDVHTMVARHCFKGEYPEEWMMIISPKEMVKPYRAAAKACIFGLVYGQGPRGLAQKLTAQGQQTSPNEASRIQHEMLELYPDLKKWIRQTHKSSDDTGFLWTPQGRVYAPTIRHNFLSLSTQSAKVEPQKLCFFVCQNSRMSGVTSKQS